MMESKVKYNDSVKKRIMKVTEDLRAKKDGKNTFQNYNYFKPDDLLRLLNPLLLENDLFMQFHLVQIADSHYKAILEISDCNSDSLELITYNFDIMKAIVKGGNDSQNSGATLTYAKRYSLMNAFNIAENKDDFDSDEYQKKEIKAVEQQSLNDKRKQIEDENKKQKLIEQIMPLRIKCDLKQQDIYVIGNKLQPEITPIKLINKFNISTLENIIIELEAKLLEGALFND